MKQKVLYYSLMPSDPTSFYRTGGILPYLNSKQFELVNVSSVTNFNWETFAGASVFIMQRPFTADHVNLLVLVKDMGIKIITDYDDDLLHVDMYNPTYEMYLANSDNFKRCVALSDEVWVSTPSIKNTLAQGFNEDKVRVIPNAHNDYLFPLKAKKKFVYNKKAMYRGGLSHQADVYERAEDLVSIINREKQWKFMFMGDRYIYLEQRCGDNYEMVRSITTMQYFKFIQQENPSLFIFPLRDSLFNRGKSNISWLEATYAGAAMCSNRTLPEFNSENIADMDDLSELLAGDHASYFEAINLLSWEEIKDTRLLSQINGWRRESIEGLL